MMMNADGITHYLVFKLNLVIRLLFFVVNSIDRSTCQFSFYVKIQCRHWHLLELSHKETPIFFLFASAIFETIKFFFHFSSSNASLSASASTFIAYFKHSRWTINIFQSITFECFYYSELSNSHKIKWTEKISRTISWHDRLSFHRYCT